MGHVIESFLVNIAKQNLTKHDENIERLASVQGVGDALNFILLPGTNVSSFGFSCNNVSLAKVVSM